ncbi:MAG: CcdB family protein [Rudaea sp.]|nr:CcdB family protein [Rudaea sp.]
MVTHRFDVFRNPNAAAAKHIPFLLVLQSELLSELPTRVVAPLARANAIKGPSATMLNPEFEIGAARVVMLTQQIAAVPLDILRKHEINLETQREAILRALDFLFNGI